MRTRLIGIGSSQRLDGKKLSEFWTGVDFWQFMIDSSCANMEYLIEREMTYVKYSNVHF